MAGVRQSSNAASGRR